MSALDPRLPVLAALLAQGRTLHFTTGVLTLGAWGLAGGAPAISGAVAGVLAIETWFAVRVGLDATLFQSMASGTTPTDLDRGLVGLGLVAERLVTERPRRALADRIDGAVRLGRWQLILTATQGALVVVALVTRWLP